MNHAIECLNQRQAECERDLEIKQTQTNQVAQDLADIKNALALIIKKQR